MQGEFVDRKRRDSPMARDSLNSSGSSGTSNEFQEFSANALSSSEGYGSMSSLDLSFSRSYGSRGSPEDEGDDVDNINVVVRCRPLDDKEAKRVDDFVLSFPGEGQLWVNMDGTNGKETQKPKVFAYNVVFEPEANQEDLVEHSGIKRLIEMAVDGFSCTVFCYGQTASGKTHTLTGPPHLFQGRPEMGSEDHGLIFRSFVLLFNRLAAKPDQQFTIKASYLEIYNEKVIDLLNYGPGTKPLNVRWNKKNRAFFVENLFSIECAELDDLLAVLEEGMANRAIASHNMNEYSSRSHTILTVSITSEYKADNGVYITKNGKVNFVDLAGSEMTKKTNSEGKTLEEANNINKSLMVLGTCIAALSDPKKRDGHIPYRDSKLTRLLADSLAGSGVTLMIACVSPSKFNLSETLNTLRYAARAKKIKSRPIIIMDPKEKLILSLQREVNLLQEENQHLQSLIQLGSPIYPTTTALISDGVSKPRMDTTRWEELLKKLEIDPKDISKDGSFQVDKEKLYRLNVSELVNLVQHYINEHEEIRKENRELQDMAEKVIQEHESISKENETLLRKLEEAYKSQPSGLGDDSSGQIWVNPANVKKKKKPPGSRMPESINKELEKRRIGTSVNDLTSLNHPNSEEPIARSGSLDRVVKLGGNGQTQWKNKRTPPLALGQEKSKKAPSRSQSVPREPPADPSASDSSTQ